MDGDSWKRRYRYDMMGMIVGFFFLSSPSCEGVSGLSGNESHCRKSGPTEKKMIAQKTHKSRVSADDCFIKNERGVARSTSGPGETVFDMN